MPKNNYPEKLKVGTNPMVVQYLKAVTPLNGSPKSGQFGDYWIIRVEYQGSEYTVFADRSFAEDAVADGLNEGDTISLWKVKEDGEWRLCFGFAPAQAKPPVKAAASSSSPGGRPANQDVYNRLPIVTKSLMEAAVKLNELIPGDLNPVAVQATFATLFISWKDLGFPLVSAETAKKKHQLDYEEEDLSPVYGDEEAEY